MVLHVQTQKAITRLKKANLEIVFAGSSPPGKHLPISKKHRIISALKSHDMNKFEIGDYPELALEEGRLKLNRDPFGRCVLRIFSERRGTEYDFFSDPDLVMRAAKLLQNAANPEERQILLSTIDRDLRILNGYLLKRDLPDVRPVIDGFMSKVKEVMRQGNCIPMGLNIQSTSQKTYDSLGRILEMTKPDRPK